MASSYSTFSNVLIDAMHGQFGCYMRKIYDIATNLFNMVLLPWDVSNMDMAGHRHIQ